ncbi:MAG: TrkH family potassium uptake protein [Verrucomicrobia bacterium]|nr:TrkH family potassium uptake protein [Verrucomicrobiota bacterium]
MNFRLLAKVLGLLLTLESLAMVVCGCFAILDPVEATTSAVAPLMTAGGLTFMAGVILVICGMGKHTKIPRREGVVIVGLGWLLCAGFGAIPFVLSEPGLTLEAAVFESVSGFTTTGSTVIDDLQAWPRGVLLWRSVTQWLGGLGILVLFVAILSAVSGGAKSLFRNESSFNSGESASARIKDTALSLWKVYVVLTVICLLGLRGLGMSWFDAVNHAFTCLATGGFSTYDDSIAHFSDWDTSLWIEIWLEIFMVLGSVSFLIYAVAMRRNWGRLKREEEAKWYLGILAVAVIGVCFVGLVAGGQDSGATLRGAVFTVISCMSTTGYATTDYELWPVGAHFILLGLMLIGGCAGSTSGGMKVSRLLLVVRAAFHEIVRAFRPNQIFRMQVNGNPIDDAARAQTVMFVALFALMAMGSMVVVAILESGNGGNFETMVAAVLATFGNIGPGFGEVGPTDTFSHLRPGTHAFLALLMVLGRLELYAVLVLFVPAAWKKY